MKIKLLTVAAGIALSAISFGAKAQKTYKEGVITYSINAGAVTAESKTYFKADSNVTVSNSGPAKISILTYGQGDYLAVLVDVPVAGWKKAAIATPAEIEDGQAKMPELTFTPGTETKQIAGFNCKKVVAKDAKGSAFDVWITNDIVVPTNGVSVLFSKVGGVPVQFKTFQMGQMVDVTLKSIAEEKAPANAFKVPADYEKISLAELQALGGKR
ncbi:hypothetical protein [Mucilaginibacter myungsuensis]|uniref:DUF4412 domain-containing protein n=1 Tax=Mucilaginibacter myungsuensis TaxID=649104 RepID=A0A929KW94_9SPHI|nr:hypothetical protein [Mucilaginibacter myungsuensis]MBE9661862.1 hypothetical protein [Mucilaginibacter myungsuensis]MDN3599704.1 hypothetical protein [Mucilaginibacter myungsuensis]